MKLIALYLPQFHPTKENDTWYGNGYTEWVNVASARPLFLGHYQPHIPKDLGFYDLRLHDVIKEQAKMAKEYGVDGFCFWHYWFGNGKTILEKPFEQLVRDKSVDIEFSLAWGNHSWYKKMWNDSEHDKLLIEQQYLGTKDYTQHFYSLLEAFQDDRYIKVNNRLLFLIYEPLEFKDVTSFMQTWNQLAEKEGLNGFYFVGHDINGKRKKVLFESGFNAIYDDRMLAINDKKGFIAKGISKVCRTIFHIPTIYQYGEAIKYMLDDDSRNENIFPVIVPNWDHSPRSGTKNIIFDHCEPKYFKRLVSKAICLVKDKAYENQIIIVKSWNEWGEGNHLEPDIKYGRGYLEAIKESRNLHQV